MAAGEQETAEGGNRQSDIGDISLFRKVIYPAISKHYNSYIPIFVAGKKDIEQFYHFPQKLYT